MDTRSCTIDQRLPVRFTQNELYLMFIQIHQSQRRLSEGLAEVMLLSFGIHEHERPVIAWSSRLRNQATHISNRSCFINKRRFEF